MNGAVIVETRNIENLSDIIERHMKYLPGWGLTIYCGEENKKILQEKIPYAWFIDLYSIITPKNYCNDVMTSVEFWESIPYEKVLIFQSDSEILREGIDDFLGWDYVGSPWQHLEVGGNGGFSLRTKSKMIELLKHKPYSDELGNEDEYFSKYLHEVGGKVACESIFNIGSFGCHAIDKHLSKEECERIRNKSYGTDWGIV
jgi:hypothetical protein